MKDMNISDMMIIAFSGGIVVGALVTSLLHRIARELTNEEYDKDNE